jgi:cathepsin B
MKSFIATTIAASASARVHEFAAESHLICELCQKAVDYEKNNKFEDLDNLYELFPKLEERIVSFKDSITDIVNLQDPVGTCQRLNLCESYNLIEMIQDNSFPDFEGIAKKINDSNTSWTATTATRFTDKTIGELKKTNGTIVDPDWTIKNYKPFPSALGATIPTDFDSRVNWPECDSVINNVRDQANCGSCWAFGTTEAFNDRICINSITNGSTIDTHYLSTADTAGCCNGKECFSFGCNGGQVSLPWGWFVRTGVVSGSGYGDGQYCYDYTMPMCAHHITDPTLADCSTIETVEPTCPTTCPTNSRIRYDDDKVKAFDSYGYSSSNTVEDIQ